MTDNAVLEAKRDALKAAQRKLEADVKSVTNEPCLPWRERPWDWTDRVAATNEALSQITHEIIDLEEQMRDPEQYSEMKYEIECAIAMSGNHNDRAEWYLHTEEQERQFQERIEHDINYGYYSEEEGWVDGIYGDYDAPAPCNICGLVTDEWISIFGWNGCSSCAEEPIAFAEFLSMLTGATYYESRRGDFDWNTTEESDQED